MDGLFIIIAIVIAVFNFAAKQQKQQNQGRGQRGMKHIPKWSEGPLADLGKNWNEMFGKPEEYGHGSMPVEEYEGKEIEDRRRTGSLDYVELSQSSEGICDEHPEHSRQKIKEKKNVLRTEPKEIEEEDIVFDITEESLLNSVIMAEVLGPPRSMKRKIR